MSWNSSIKKELDDKRKTLYLAGGAERQKKVKSKGQLTARERMEELFDDGQFTEIEAYATTRIKIDGLKKKNYVGDGVVCGFGKVNGRIIYAASQDSTVSGGAGGEAHVEKICRTLSLAIQAKRPFICFCESGGARIEEGIVSLAAYSRLFKLNATASGYIPQIAAIMGNCAGGSSYSPAMCDFTFIVRETGQFFITGPKVVKALTGETITMDELGGAEIHEKYTGQTHFTCDNDLDCIEKIKKLLEYIDDYRVLDKVESINFDRLEEHNDYKTIKTKQAISFEEIVPEQKKKPYDVRNIINLIVDDNSFLEVQETFASNIVIGFAKIYGNPIGIVANQPNVIGGAIDCDAADKAARFVRTNDCFGIPVLVLVDVPGFMPGIKEERKGILRHGSKLLFAFSEATVPKVTLILRKAYGGAYCAMNSKDLGADYVLAWPLCEIAVMGADGAVDVMYHRQIEDSDNGEEIRNIKIAEYEEKYLNASFAASLGLIDDVIMPEETREKVAMAFESLKGKDVQIISKKHGNISL